MSGLDVTGDMAGFDGLESVTLRSADGGQHEVVDGALRRAMRWREGAASAGQYVASDVRWHLPAAGMSLVPSVGMRLEDGAGQRWTILEVIRESWGTRWACVARNLAIAEGLNDVVTIQQATWVKGTSGAVTAEWNDLLVDVRGRLQTWSGDVGQRHQQRVMAHRYRLFLEDAVEVDGNQRVVHVGEVYHIVGFRLPERIDELMVLELSGGWPLGGE